MLTSKITKTLDVPGEPGEHITIRRLSGKAIEEARREFSRSIFTIYSAEMIERMQAKPSDPDEAATEASPLAGYDVATVLRCGITAWSYSKRPTPEQIDDLDEQTREWAATEILALGRETEAERKNG